ncbi:hypothetical protein [Rhizobium leguminosarum]|uniref:hypothetical protein n=1 Tax=Rhizobium leguminosarum TaxID=384 RepID=UPI00143F2C62|nr:hypothetical protein [Rhizobium leguminosarum]NKL25136.1 hypothetical protein [Rhizobium leguminosarum bv. viciae]
MTEHIEPRQVETDDLTKVWSVTEFCARHRIDTEEQALLLKLFGPFATALLHGSDFGRGNPIHYIFHATRSNLGRPSSVIRLRTRTLIFASYQRERSVTLFEVSKSVEF